MNDERRDHFTDKRKTVLTKCFYWLELVENIQSNVSSIQPRSDLSSFCYSSISHPLTLLCEAVVFIYRIALTP